MKLELTCCLVVNRQTCDVSREQVAGALDPSKAQPQCLGNADSEGGLAETREIFYEEVPMGEKRDER
jgi:hypothetical protein